MPVPSRGLARPHKKILTERKMKNLQNENYFANITLSDSDKTMIKTKKCQPAAGDRLDLIQTRPVPSKGLTRQQNKNNGTKNEKNNMIEDFSNVTLALISGHTNWLTRKQRNRSIKMINGNGSRVLKLKIIQWNGGSRLWENKVTELESLVMELKPDICIITEANLWSGVEDCDSEIPGYYKILPNTITSLLYARIVCLVRDDLNVHMMKEHMSPDTATVWLRVGSGRNAIVIGGIYNEFTQLGVEGQLSAREKLLKQEARWKKIVTVWKRLGLANRCYVLGDLNLDFKCWNNPEARNERMIELTKEYIELSGFQQLISTVTRQMRNQEDSIIDQIWTNCGHLTVRHFNISRASSDHNVIGVELAPLGIKVNSQNTVRRVWKNFDEKRCLERFREIDWSNIMGSQNVNVANAILEENICHILDKEAPIKTMQSRARYTPWLTDSTKAEMISRDIARDIAKLSDLEVDWTDYRQKRNECTRLQRQDKAVHQRRFFEKIEIDKDSGSLFRTTKQLLSLKSAGPPTSLRINGVINCKQSDMANELIKYYVDKVVDIKSRLPRVNIDPLWALKRAYLRWQPTTGKPTFNLKTVTMQDVSKMIKALKKSHAFGNDNFDAMIVKVGAPVILPVITHVINLSLTTLTFPARWKISRIIPLLKSRDLDRNLASSYRPVSNLPVISKLTERAVQQQILVYLEENNLLSHNHHAYRAKTNTTTSLIQIMDTIATGTDLNLATATMSLDLSAAFDTVSHDILLQKLLFYGLDSNTVDWIKSYLSFRSGFVVIGSAKSAIHSIPQGVPQGSVMGPLLYLLFVNEMPHVIEDDLCANRCHDSTEFLFTKNCNDCGEFPMYADDGVLIISGRYRGRNQQKIETCFWKLKSYLNANGLQLNDAKTSLTEFMTHQKRAKLSGIPPDLTVQEILIDREGREVLADKLITDSNYCRFLGLNLQNNLMWDSQLNSGKKATLPATRRLIGLISRLRRSLSEKAALQLANALIVSKILYGIAVWGNASPNYIKSAQTVLNSAARMITGLRRTTKQQELMDRCKWLDIAQLSTLHSLTQLWKAVHWKSPVYLRDKLIIDDRMYISCCKPRLLLTSYNFRHRTIRNWNFLPDMLRNENSLLVFKKGVKELIKSRRLDPGLTDEVDHDLPDIPAVHGRPPDINV